MVIRKKTGAKIKSSLLRELNRESRLWDVLVDPARKIRIGNKLYFGDDDLLVAEVIDNTTSRGRTLRFLFDGPWAGVQEDGLVARTNPLPKYIKRKAEPEDADRYPDRVPHGTKNRCRSCSRPALQHAAGKAPMS